MKTNQPSKNEPQPEIPQVKTVFEEENIDYTPFDYIAEKLYLIREQIVLGNYTEEDFDSLNEFVDQPDIQEQLQKINPDLLKKELEQYGEWYDEQLNDHEENLRRLLGVICGDIVDCI